MINSLAFTAVTSNGRAFDIDFPLHPHTRSATGVAHRLTTLFEAVSDTQPSHDDTSDGVGWAQAAHLLVIGAFDAGITMFFALGLARTWNLRWQMTRARAQVDARHISRVDR